MTVTDKRGTQIEGRVSRRLFTIGYNGTDVKHFFAELDAAGVTHLVDVRRTGRSRKPGFAKSQIERNAKRRKVQYEHRPLLGPPVEERKKYLASGDWTWFSGLYKGLMSDGTVEWPTLRTDLDSWDDGHAALMCMCVDGTKCHRGLLAKKVVGRGGTVTHLAPKQVIGQ